MAAGVLAQLNANARPISDNPNPSTSEGRAKALSFCQRWGTSEVYLGVSGGEADPAALKEARDYSLWAGIEVSGVLATLNLGKPSTQWKIVLCYTNQATREHLRQVMQLLAGVFDEVIIVVSSLTAGWRQSVEKRRVAPREKNLACSMKSAC